MRRPAPTVANRRMSRTNHERYELIIPNHFLDLPAVVATLRVLRRSAVRAQIEAMGGYDCVSMGELS